MADQIVVSFDFPGVEEGERAVKMLSSLQSTLQAGRGSGKSLEELRRIMVGLRGQTSVFEDLRDSMKSMAAASESVKRSFASSIGSLGTIIKQEFAEVKQIMQMNALELGKTVGSGLGKGMEESVKSTTQKTKSLLKSQLQDLQASYESEIRKGVKFTEKDLIDLKSWGVNIGADARARLRDALVSGAAGNKITPEQLLGITKADISNTAKESAAVFQAAFAAQSAQEGSAINRMLGLDAVRVAKSAKDSASVFQAAFATEAARTRQNVSNLEQMLGISKSSVAKSAKESAAVFQQTWDAELTKIRAQVKEATLSTGMMYSSMSSGKLMNAKEIDNVSKSLRQLTIDGNDAHSMARGLASGFNLLWLTWGNLLPLFAGASISFGLKKTFDIGSEVEYLIKFMETLGQTVDATGKHMEHAGGIIRQALRDIDQTTQFSLTELSQAMVRLGQAGQTPAQALQTLRPAADLASVGMTDLKVSTDLLIQTQALFGKSTADMGKMAAQIFQITKSGVLNVEDISGSMKYASEANTRFGKSLEETLTLLGALAQAGLKGSSGGTALINFYRDLNGRSGPAVKALKELEKATGATIEVFDKFGKQRSGIDIFNDIATAADKLKAKDADKLLAKIFSDRGGRTFFAMIRDGTLDLQKMQQQLEQTDPSVLFEAAKGLMDTTKGALNVLQGSLVGALDQVFEAYSKDFKTFITDITAIVDSAGFRLAVAGMVESMMTLYQLVKDFGPVLVAFFGAWAGMKVLSAGVAIFQGLSAVLATLAPSLAMSTTAFIRQTLAAETNGRALIANAAAQRAAAAGADAVAASTAGAAASTAVMAARVGVAGLALRGLAAVIGFLANPLVGLVATVGLLGSAWFSAKSGAESAMGGTASSVLENGKIIEGQLLKEISLARQRNAIVGGSAFAEQEAQLSVLKQKQSKLAEQATFLMDKSQNEAINPATRKEAGVLAQGALATLQSNQKAINNAQAALDQGYLDIAKAAEERDKKLAASAAASAKRLQTEMNAPDLQTGGGGRGRPGQPSYVEGLRVANDNELKEIEKRLSTELGLLRSQNENAKQIMDAKHSNGLLREGQYQAELFKQTQAYESQTLAAITAATSSYETAYQDRRKRLESALGVAEGAKRADDIQRLTQEIENLDNAQRTFSESNAAKRNEILAASYTRIELAAVKAEGVIRKLADTERDYWAKEREEISKEQGLAETAKQWAVLNESVLSFDKAQKAAAESAAAETVKYNAHLEKLDRGFAEAEQAAVDFMMANIAALASGNTEAGLAYENLLKIAEQYRKIREEAGANAAQAIADRSLTAFNRVRTEQLQAFSNELADAVATSIFEGGKAGGKKMRDVLQQELLRKPLVALIQGVMQSLVGGIGNMVSGLVSNVLGGLGSNIFGSLLGSGATSALGLGGMGAAFGQGFMSSISGMLTGGAPVTSLGMGAGGAAFNFGGAVGAAAPYMAIAGVVLNALGAFRSERKVGSGISGTLGQGDITPWEEWRQGGTLFSGPSYSTMKPVEELAKARQRLKNLQDQFGRGELGNPQALVLQQSIVDEMERNYGSLEAGAKAQSKVIQDAFASMRKNVLDMSKVLGLSTKAVEGYTTQLGGSEKGLNFEGLDNEQIQAKIAEALATANNELAQQVIGRWETTTKTISRVIGDVQGTGEDAFTTYTEFSEVLSETRYVASEYAKEGEKAIDTLTRLATNLATVNATFDTLGYKLLEASLKGGDLAGKIIEAFGDVEKYTTAISSYYENFYTPEERKATTLRQMNEQFKAMGLEMPKTREAYRKLVEAQDLTTEAGRKQFATLVQLAPAYAAVTEAIEDSLERLRGVTDDAMTALEAAVSKQREAAQAALDAAQSQVDAWKSILDILQTNIRELRNEVTQTAGWSAQQGRAFLDQALIDIRAGKAPDAGELGTAIGAVRGGIDSTVYTSQFEEDKARMLLAGQLDTLADAVKPQLTIAEQMLAIAERTIKDLDAILEYWEEQINIARGIKTGTDDIATAIANLTAALIAETAASTDSGAAPGGGGGGFVIGGGGGGGGGGGSSLSTYQEYEAQQIRDYVGRVYSGTDDYANPAALAQISAMAGMERWTLQQMSQALQVPAEDIQSLFVNAGLTHWSGAAFANGGNHSGGLRLVGEKSWELEATGPSRIWTPNQIANAVSGQPDDTDAAAVNADAAVKQEARDLAILRELADMRRIMTEWNIDGMPMERVE